MIYIHIALGKLKDMDLNIYTEMEWWLSVT